MLGDLRVGTSIGHGESANLVCVLDLVAASQKLIRELSAVDRNTAGALRNCKLLAPSNSGLQDVVRYRG